MTFIQPNKKFNASLASLILVVLVCGVAAGVFGMVALYNSTVNLSHNIAAAKAELDSIGAQNTTLNNEILAATTGAQLTNLAQADGLVTDPRPQYFAENQNQSQTDAWPLASQ
jgi:cell division protein FtsB